MNGLSTASNRKISTNNSLSRSLSLLYIIFQAKCEAAYFVLVLHHLRSIVIAVRGTETPEDLIIDGLCKECILSAKDLDGLIKYLSFHFDFCLFLFKRICVILFQFF